MTGENPLQRVMALRARAEAAARQGLEDVVLELYGEAVAASREGDDRRLMGHTIRHRGDALRRAGRLEEARQCYVEALELYGGAPRRAPAAGLRSRVLFEGGPLKSLGKKATGERLARMRASPQWTGSGFGNVAYQPPAGPREPMPLLEFFCPKEQRKPLRPLPSLDPTPGWRARPDTGLRVTWLGHSTLLLEIGGRRVLTDPMWGKRASPARGMGPKRFQPVPVPLDGLPPVDLVLLSHDHYDHLDYRTIRALRSSDVPFVAPLGVGAHLEAWGIEPARVTELDWWETADVGGGDVVIHATPAQHFSGRAPGGRNSTLWASYVLESADHRVFFGGDSGMMPGFRTIGDRFRPFDLVCLEIGAYHPAWGDIHLGPVNALAAKQALGGGPLLPIHWGTFDLATHRWDQPIEVVAREAAAAGVELITPRLGEPTEPVRSPGLRTWWREVAALHGDAAHDGGASREPEELPEEPVD